MLLGCCHCDEIVVPSSSSIPSSGISEVAGCSNCVVAPRRFSMVHTTPVNGTAYPCCTDYRSSLVLEYSSGCVWRTLETGMYACTVGGVKTCFNSSHSNVKPRFTLTITGSLTYTITMIHYIPSGIGTALRQRAEFIKTVTSSDCFATVRIPFSSWGSFSSDTISIPPGGTSTGGQPDLCSTVARVAATTYIDITPF